MRVGYKESPLGEIPLDWEVKKLGRIAHTFAGGTPKRGVKGYYNGTIPWIKSGEVNNNSIESSEEFVTELALKDSSAKLIKPNSILVALYGATAGKVGVLKVAACSNQAVLAVTSKLTTISNNFLYHYLKKCTIELLNLCQGSGQPNLSKSIVEGVQIPLPPLQEQQKIAEILSTVDDKIDVIDQQIIETQALKKGLMQRLLTKGIGHTEFKDSPLGEIPESWEVDTINNVFEYIKTLSLSRAQLNYDSGEINYVHYGDIHSTFKFPIVSLHNTVLPLINEDVELNGDLQYLNDGDLIIADASEDLEGVGKCVELVDINDKKIIGGLHTIVLRDKKNLTVLGIKPYLLYSSVVMKSLKRIATGASVLGVSKGNLNKIHIPLPPISEQKQIAKILGSVDEKLEVLSDKKTHYQELKQGLMQQLLTGKIRVAV